jgi:hypothetical protein
MPIVDYRPVSRVRPECNWLQSFSRDVTSQSGQDGVLQKIFEIVGVTSKFCVEFGGWDGKYLSNTWRLIVEEEWSGIFAEANPVKCREIKQHHPYDRVKALPQLITWEGETSFDHTMARENAPSSIDLVSIDVDGNDWHIWKAMGIFRPRVVVIEFNPTIPNDVYFVQDADINVNHGNSLLALIELGKSKGYALVCAGPWDAFFVVDELYPLFNIPDNSIDSMWSGASGQTVLFQGYDGTLFTAGMQRLIWKGIPFDGERLQLLSKEERFYGDRPPVSTS